MEEITLPRAARLLGIHSGTLRQAIQRGTLTARLVQESRGIVYWVQTDEVERYRAEHLGKLGRPRKSEQNTGNA